MKHEVGQSRSEATREKLMNAAEKLIATSGIEGASVRAIVTAAGQKNESALHYHFKNRLGLLNAIHRRRNAQVQTSRTQMLQAMLANNPEPGLREVCTLMIEPAFRLAQTDAGFRRYVRAFSQQVATTELPAAEFIRKNNDQQATTTLHQLLRANVATLPEAVFQFRFDSAIRLIGLSMSLHARSKHAFRGNAANAFLEMMVDAVVGVFAAGVSDQTLATLNPNTG